MMFLVKLALGVGALLLISPTIAQSKTTVSPDPIISLKEKPQRIISLSPVATEILFAAGCGAQTVARTSLCTYPPAAKSLPIISTSNDKTYSIELILSFEPDFVYGTVGIHDYVRSALAPFEIPVFLSSSQSLSDVIHELNAIGTLATEGVAMAQTAVKRIAWERAAVRTKLDRHLTRRPLRVYWEIQSTPPLSVGKMSFINCIIEEAGGSNICSAIQADYPEVSSEFIVAQDPEVIIVLSDSFSGTAETVCASFSARNGWSTVSAVKNKRVIIMDAELMSRCGPRIGEAVMNLSKKLYPDIWTGSTEDLKSPLR